MLAPTYSPVPNGTVPSALEGLTSVFGMGTGVTPLLQAPANSFLLHFKYMKKL